MKHLKPIVKLNQDFWKTILIDLILYVSLFLSVRLWFVYLVRVFGNLNPDSLEMMSEIEMMSFSQNLTYMWNKFLVSFVILMIITLIIWSLFKYIIWNIILKKKFNLDTFKRFAFLNIVWFMIIASLFVAATYPYLSGLETNISTLRFTLSVIITALAIYLTNVFYIFFIEKPEYTTIKNVLKFSYEKLLHMLPVYAIIYLVFVVSSIIGSYYMLLSASLFIFITAWARLYVNKAVHILK